MANYLIKEENLTSIANAIRSKTNKTDKLYPNEMAAEIISIEGGIDTSDATATASDILSGETAYVNGEKITGNIATKTSSDITASGATVTVPAGYYASQMTKSVSSGSAKTPATTVTKNPTISVNTSGLITASVSGTQSVTPMITAGYVSSGTAGTITVSGSATKQLTTKGATTITPGTSNQTAVASGVYTTGTITVAGDSNLVAGNIVKGKSIFGVNGNYEGSTGIDTSDATATADEIFSGETAYVNGSKVTGTFTINNELSVQTDLITQIQSALEGKAAGGGGESALETVSVTISNSNAMNYVGVYYTPNTQYYDFAEISQGSTCVINIVKNSTITIADMDGMPLNITINGEPMIDYDPIYMPDDFVKPIIVVNNINITIN